MISRKIVMLILISVLMTILSCKDKPVSNGPVYSSEKASVNNNSCRFAVHPLINPASLFQKYQPLIDYLNKKIPECTFALEASRDYPDYERKIKEAKLDFLLPNPWQTLKAMKVGYNVIAMSGDANDFKGLFIVRNDSKIVSPKDLKGKAVSYPAQTALAACIMPQYFLHSHGIDVNHDIENRFVGSQESSILNAYLGQTAVGVTWPQPWRIFQKEHPKEAGELKVLWETPPLINNSVMARTDIPAELRQKVSRALFELNDSPEGRTILSTIETSRFTKSDNRSYDVVQKYIDQFEKEVRKVETDNAK